MPSPSLLPLVDRLIEGGIEAFLTDARQRGESYQAIAARLGDEHRINVTPPTIRAWCIEYGIVKIGAE